MQIACDERRGRRFERGKQLNDRVVFVMESHADADAAIGSARLSGQVLAAGDGGPNRGRQLFDPLLQIGEAIASPSPAKKSARLLLAATRHAATRARRAGNSLAVAVRCNAIMRRCSKIV